jgi:hypothetical protein
MERELGSQCDVESLGGRKHVPESLDTFDGSDMHVVASWRSKSREFFPVRGFFGITFLQGHLGPHNIGFEFTWRCLVAEKFRRVGNSRSRIEFGVEAERSSPYRYVDPNCTACERLRDIRPRIIVYMKESTTFLAP